MKTSMLPMIMSSHVEPKPKIRNTSIDKFAKEILADLPKLIEEHPEGVHISHMHEWFGEGAARILKACQYLKAHDLVELHQSASKAHYITPVAYIPGIPFPELTELQRKVALYISKTCKAQDATQLRTNYSQLSRILECSYGGLRTCLNRLVSLHYIYLSSPSKPGRQDQLVITLGQILVDHNLDH